MVLAAVLAVSMDLTAVGAPRGGGRDRSPGADRLAAAGKTLSIEITIGVVRIEGSDREDAEIIVERRAPNAAQLERVPLTIDDTAARVSVRALQTENTTDPAIRADVTVRLPRAAAVDHVQVLEGRIAITGFSGRISADIRRGPIEARICPARCGSRPASARSR